MAAIAVVVLGLLFTLAAAASFLLLPLLMKVLPHPPEGRAPEDRGVGRKLGRLELYPLTVPGKVLGLRDIQGRVVLLDFWGTWCPPCREELPHIAHIEQKLRGQQAFQVLAVSCGRAVQDDLEQLRKVTKEYLDQQHLDMPTYADPNFVTRNAVNEVGRFEGYPTTLILDRQGVIRGVWVGYEAGVEQEIEDLVDQLLAEQ